MDPTQKTALIDAIETAFARQGVNLYDGAKRLTALLDSALPHIRASQSRELLEAHFDSPEPMHEEQLQNLVAFFLTVPQILEQFVMDSTRKAVESLPRPTGPPVRVTPEQKRGIVEYVGRLHTKGVDVGDAQRQAALHFDHSFRSIQRVWQQRKTLPQHPFLGMEDVWSFLMKHSPS